MEQIKTERILKEEKELQEKPKINYNSKLPIVVYVPDGYSLEYRIWKANDKLILVK